MSLGFLWSVGIVSIGTACALWPVRRPGPLRGLCFRIGLLVSELPFIALLFVVFSPALAFAQGDVDTVGDAVVVGLAVLTVAGLVVVVRRALRARRVVADALDASYGLDEESKACLRQRLPWARILFRPFFTRRFDVRRIGNLRYGDAGRRNLLDVYLPRSGAVRGPVLIHLHGGAYFAGRKNSQALPMIYRLASKGWLCISANYRLRPEAEHPAHLVDYKRVIAWARAHAAEYGADPSLLFATGSSAGGHMAALAGLTPNDPAYQPGFEDVDTTVTAVISLGGYHGNYYGQGESSSPVGHVRADAPPFFIVHGEQDTMVPVDTARTFATALAAVSTTPVAYAQLPGAQHSFDLFHSIRFESVVNSIEAFTTTVLGRLTRSN
ncbi:alpha/beta hydrolase fold domain-containing protein [Kribbella sp. CA-247076]|uniref:alpha/beta hydrolase fold domain-containing protein n=1 Tax=Kribbella sp. CA-247076 TaxID=3239941 RepID=UPI003D8B63EF